MFDPIPFGVLILGIGSTITALIFVACLAVGRDPSD
jgi:hypothetical protein